MKKYSMVAISLLFSLFVSVIAQQQQTPPPVAQPDTPPKNIQNAPVTQKEDVVRISVNLVQIDAVVTDNDGAQVTNLSPEDFEIYEDNKPQQIVNFSYVSKASITPPPPAKPAVIASGSKTTTPAPPAPPVRLRPEQVRRAIALVVDDLGLSFESSHYVRDALRKFVDQQMLPGDLVAIIRTGAGMGALQQFTSDKRQLHAAIEKVRFNLSSRSFSAFAPIGNEIRHRVSGKPSDSTQRAGEDLLASLINQPGKELNDFREEIFSVGTLGALNFIVRGLKELPGRKSVVLFSDGFKMYDENVGNQRIIESLNRLTDLANRASVVFYTIDPRGLQPLTITAADNLSGPFGLGDPSKPLRDILNHEEYLHDIEKSILDRRKEFFESQQGLNYLAQQTGGFLVKNTNDISGAVRRVLNEEGYYLIGYRPDEATFKAEGSSRSFRKITVKAKRPGLRVRTRTGFYGIADEQARPVRRTGTEQLYAALTSPFAAGDVRLRMTSLFGYDKKKGSFAQSLLHIDARDLSFEEETEGVFKGYYKTRIEVMAMTFGDNGVVLDQDDRVYTVRLPAQDYRRSVDAGLTYSVSLLIKKPGAYQLRIAVRDTKTERVGSANQLIEIPDIKKGRLTLSGITLSGVNPVSASQPATGAAASPVAGQIVSQTNNQAEAEYSQAGRVVRKLRRGMVMEYAYYIYNPRIDKATRRPQLETQIKLFRDGQQVYTGKVYEFTGGQQADSGQFVGGGALQLVRGMEPGEYVLQVIVTDRLAKEDKYRTATQWMDFDIVR